MNETMQAAVDALRELMPQLGEFEEHVGDDEAVFTAGDTVFTVNRLGDSVVRVEGVNLARRCSAVSTATSPHQAGQAASYVFVSTA
ncbi:hypothetical protein [Tepidiforma sp.]|uniref:hypothetical protein n=1 Tax=Tepidiforma sp. TaxID=2682230 RepID=UPI0026263019|nr:hypothetical protein [Tepidiforma sp.]MCX7618909.1 hypothetical protein [Tepidiforma sp.]